jgi:hypothetical protein
LSSLFEYVEDPCAINPARIVRLAAAGGVEDRILEDNVILPGHRLDSFYFCLELSEERIGVIGVFQHRYLLKQRVVQ